MSKRGFEFLTDSNALRGPFDTHFKAFEWRMRGAKSAFESLRIRSNALESKRKTFHA